MPTPNVGVRVAANWEKVVKTKPEDQSHDDYWLLDYLKRGKGFMGLDGGDFITVSIEYALNGTVSSYSDTDTIDITRQDVFDRYEFQWKENGGSVVHSDLERDRNMGAGQVFPLLPAKMQSLRKSIRSDINTQLFSDGTGNSSKDMLGLQGIIATDPTSGTFGGVSRASFSFARSQQVTGTKTTSAFDNLRASMRNCYNSCSDGYSGEHPTGAVTTQTVFEGFEGLLIANEQFTKKGKGEGAFDTLTFKGAEIAFDNDCPSGILYFLNPKFLKLCYKKGQWMKAIPSVRPADQTLEVTLIRTMAQLISTNPRRLGCVTVIT